MKHWLLIASIAITGLFIAKATFDAGLKQFAYAIGLTGAVGWLLIGFDLFLVGGALLAISCGLVMISWDYDEKLIVSDLLGIPPAACA